MTMKALEQRVTRLERKLDAILETPKRNGRWYVENSGQFLGDPVYAEIARLGRKYRESLRPKPPRKSKR